MGPSKSTLENHFDTNFPSAHALLVELLQPILKNARIKYSVSTKVSVRKDGRTRKMRTGCEDVHFSFPVYLF